jgi:putative tryptophan/tyrosine transport system substrate-binding protein
LRRRDFITFLGTAAAWPRVVRAQQPNRVRRVGMLIGGSASDAVSQRLAAVSREALGKLGWTDGGNVRIDLRFVGGDIERVSASAAEVVGLAPDVVFVATGTATQAVQQRTRTIPIVYIGPGPEAVLVKNIARPEGNITGFPILYPEIAGKWVELLKEADLRVARISLYNNVAYFPFALEAAAALAVKLDAVASQDDAATERAIDAFAAERNGGVIVMPSTVSATRDNRDLFRRLAVKHRLPTIHWDSAYPAEGGLMSYGSNVENLHRRAASYVDRLLRGAKVSELPVDRPTKFELIINVKAARAIGLTIPEAFLLRADGLID